MAVIDAAAPRFTGRDLVTSSRQSVSLSVCRLQLCLRVVERHLELVWGIAVERTDEGLMDQIIPRVESTKHLFEVIVRKTVQKLMSYRDGMERFRRRGIQATQTNSEDKKHVSPLHTIELRYRATGESMAF